MVPFADPANQEQDIFAVIPLSPTMYGALGAAVVIAGLTVGISIQTVRLDAAVARHEAFVAKTEAIGKAQEAAAKIKDAQNVSKMEAANAQNMRARRELDGVYATYRQLRDQRTSGGAVSSAPTLTASADRITFDSQELIGAIRSLEAGILGIAQQGDQAIADLNTAKSWAQSK